MTCAPLACRALTVAASLSNRSISYTVTWSELSILPVSCHCQLAPGAMPLTFGRPPAPATDATPPVLGPPALGPPALAPPAPLLTPALALPPRALPALPLAPPPFDSP